MSCDQIWGPADWFSIDLEMLMVISEKSNNSKLVKADICFLTQLKCKQDS